MARVVATLMLSHVSAAGQTDPRAPQWGKGRQSLTMVPWVSFTSGERHPSLLAWTVSSYRDRAF